MKLRALFILLLSPYLLAQQQNTAPVPNLAGPAAIEQEPDPENDMEMGLWLNANGKEVERLEGLGVERDIAESTTSSIIGGWPLYVNWQTARARAGDRFALLFFPCNEPVGFAYLYTLNRQVKSWHITDRIELDCHYDDSVSFQSIWIRDPNNDEVMSITRAAATEPVSWSRISRYLRCRRES